ncbi:MAG: hypothetical protein ABSA44_03955 [Bacteroidota bacterium]|jgi:hypothetical protein
MSKCFFIILFLAPYIVGFAPQDSSYTEWQIGAGGGQYTYEDCSGEHTSHFYDAGIRVTTKLKSPWRLGASISAIPSNGSLTVFGYPDFAYDNGFFSLGTTGLRVGYLERTFFEIKGLDEIPYTTGKGLFRIGMGTPITQNGTRIWMGANVGVYQSLGFGTSLEFPLQENYSLSLTGRYGEHNSIPEYGISLGLKFRR